MKKKKIVKKIKRKKAAVKKPKKTEAKATKEKPVGKVTHYFGNIKVGVIKCKKPIKIGDEIKFKGATTDFKQIVKSMQKDYKDVKVAPPNKEVGIKVKSQVREGDLIFK